MSYDMHVQLYNAPRSAGLPMTRNMPYSQTSMPTQSQPRNMTGIYLGLEGNLKPPRPKTGVPPLARSRGSSRMKTPTEAQRYKRVELLRIKEEKRGFSGNPVKRHQHPSSAHHQPEGGSGGVPAGGLPTPALTYPPDLHVPTASSSDQQHGRRWGPGKRIDPGNLDDLLRPNPRNYTTVSNSGVTRSEKLTGWLSDSGRSEVNTVANDDLAGLEECFRKVCNGNVEVLYSLLPGRKLTHVRREHANTGFTVRSYRNPKQAEILADFSVGGSGFGGVRAPRPKTVPIRRPVVPQPYFFRHYSTHPGATTIASQPRYLAHGPGNEDAVGNYFHSTSKILASPGAGTISRSLNHRLTSATPTLAASNVTAPAALRGHNTSPTLADSSDNFTGHDPKGFQSGESTNRTVQDSEDTPLTATSQSTTGQGQGVHVTVLPTTRLLDSTNDTSATLDDTATPGRTYNDSEDLEEVVVKATTSSDSTPRPAELQGGLDLSAGSVTPRLAAEEGGAAMDARIDDSSMDSQQQQEYAVAEVKVFEDNDGEDLSTPSTTGDSRPRPKLTASNSGADIMLGLETEEGQSAEVEIDAADQEELMPEAEVPKGRVRKASITEKVIKTKASEAMAALIKEEAESRQREFEKLLDEHAELVQEISRTPSSENLIQGERDH